jgi:glycosyltransferase involved in cell wall biosynthesis
MDKISVITPTYNDGDTLELHIETFLDQDYPEKELILVDDGSTDNTKKILKKYESNEDIKVIRFKSNKGACEARNAGAKIAEGEVYSFLPADSFLKPGMLRIWMQMLEDSPEYAFIYGGYTFVDNQIKKPTWLGGRLTMPYHSQEFDVRELKSANYIDGSFPIRKDAYWGAAEAVGLKDGLWNPQVKSLQDWDFWLSVVIEYGGKGRYYNSQFFETTIPHEGGLSDDSSKNWLARTKQIQMLHGIKPAELCVTAPFAPWHGKSVAKILDADYRDYPPMKPHDYKAIYIIGFFCYNFEDVKSVFMAPSFLPKVNLLKAQGKWSGEYPMSQAKKLVHFIGSDILTLRKLPLERLNQVIKFLKTCDGVFAELPATQKELKAFGIEADVVPFPPRKWYDEAPKPKKKAIAVYLPKDNDEFYFRHLFLGYEKKKGLIHAMPDVDFHVFGNPLEIGPKNADNYKNWGRVEDVGKIIDSTNAIIRLTPHDGLPISIAEWISAGRNAMTTVKMPYAEHFDLKDFMKRNPTGSVSKMITEVKKRIYEVLEKPVNKAGATHYRKWLDAEQFKKNIASYTKYDEKRYWEKRADSWDQQAQVDIVKRDKLRQILDSLSFDSVLDVGCGNGRFVPFFEGKDYAGFDISERLVEICKERFPDLTFVSSSVEESDKAFGNIILPSQKHLTRQFDLIFCYTVLEHVPPHNLDKAVAALKKLGKKMLLIEPKDFVPNADYCYSHDYRKHFKIKKRWGMGDKWAYLIDL